VTTAPLLIVEHQDTCPPGWVGDWLTEAGIDLDVRRPYLGDDLPEDLTGHAAMIVLGGSMGADDDAEHPWLTPVKELIRRAAADGTPTLGICLGHQLAASALGGRVERNPRGQQVGVLDVGWTPDAADDPLLAPMARAVRAVQWNNDIVTATPPGSVVLAQTGNGEIQAARFAPSVWGVQWHPEAGEEIVRHWAESDRDQAAERGVDLDGYVAAVGAATDELRSTWRQLAERFAALASPVARTGA
jgi:GMP synthase (glutamine-hydrolysing)